MWRPCWLIGTIRIRCVAAVTARHLLQKFEYVGDAAIINAVLAQMQRDGRLRLDDRTVGLADRGPKLSKGEQELMRQLIERFRVAGFQPPSLKDCEQAATKNQKSVRSLVALAASDGDLVEIGDGLYLHAEVEQELRRRLAEAFREKPELTMSEIRETLGTSRKVWRPHWRILGSCRVYETRRGFAAFELRRRPSYGLVGPAFTESRQPALRWRNHEAKRTQVIQHEDFSCMANNPLRHIPSVHELLDSPPLRRVVDKVSHNVVVAEVRSFLDHLRGEIQQKAADVRIPAAGELADRIAQWILADQRPRLRPVINATGVILHTGLGRSPLGRRRPARCLCDGRGICQSGSGSGFGCAFAASSRGRQTC